MTAISDYIDALNANLARGDATEHTHRPALKTLLDALGGKGITATNEPKRIDCGAPDFNVTKGTTPLGHIETKDIGVNLDEIEKGKGPHGKQFIRYRDGLPNWILTDYLEFRWFVNGEKRLSARLGAFDGKKKVRPAPSDGVAELLNAFLKQEALTITNAKDLAERLAGMTRIIHDLIIATFGTEPEDGLLHGWLDAFRHVLIPDLTKERFSDMFAQTMAYGLFAARVHSPQAKEFSRANAAFNLPKTNPFLRKLFSEIGGVDMPETIDWAVDDVIELLRHADMDNVLKDFPQGKGKEDPVIHFYETFLAVYNPALRQKLGVFYTPHAVVSYIVRSVDQLLVNRFARPKGLGDEHTLILDPAVGTATFLYSVIEQIYEKFETQRGAWDGYVASHLLGRVFGFELLMAPYAVAHLKIGMQLEQTGYHFGSDQRLGIYLTNTLEEAMTKSEKLFEKWISDEANEAAAIKRDKPILVVLGNPPYSGESANRSRDEDGNSTFIGKLIDDYKTVDGQAMREKVLKWLHDDYVKFIRFAQWRLDRTGEGIIAYITNNAYLDNPTFPGMRRALMNSFSELWIYNLHGSTRKRDETPEGGEDKNVFDIMQGVTILLGVKEKGHAGPTVVHYADLWGTREYKYATLLDEHVNATHWTEINPRSPNYFFVPEDSEFEEEYRTGWRITDIFALHHTGIITKRDALAIHWTADDCFRTVKEFASLPAESAREKFGLPADVRDWKVEWAQADIRKTGPAKKHVIPVLYRPFDVRYTYYTGNSRGFLGWPVADVTPHMLPGDNIGLVTTRLTKGERFQHVLLTRHMNEVICLSSKTSNNGFIFPLYLYAGEQKTTTGHVRRPNFDPSFLKALADALGVKQGHPDDLPEGVTAEDIIGYICAILHSPVYRARYASLLARDFPRIPITKSKALFSELAKVGRELIALHLLESSKVGKFTTSFPVAGSNIVERVQFDADQERVAINETQYFGNVPAEAWDFFVGGYRVADKWLKDRRNRKLTYEDIQHYQRIIAAALETRALMKRLDAIVEKCGGWPIAV